MTEIIHYNKATYLTSAADLGQLPPDNGYEVAFVGRSNSGKSSSLNTITNIKGLARTSKTPGRTQMINFFALDDQRRLVDLPGYGYAKAPRAVQERWERATHEYLETRQCLRGLILLMDIRHPLKDLDQKIIAWTASCGVPLHILLTKSDKLKFGAAKKTLLTVAAELAPYGDAVTLQLFSSLDKRGVDDVKRQLSLWLNDEQA